MESTSDATYYESMARTLDLNTALDLAIKESFPSRRKAEEVYQARQEIYVRIGRLLPSLNFDFAFSLTQQAYNFASTFVVGFLYPSNWTRWGESKLYFEAQRHSFAALLANQVVTVETIFYEIATLEAICELYEDFNTEIAAISKDVEARITDPYLTEQPLREARAVAIVLARDRATIANALENIRVRLLFSLGIDAEIWPSYRVLATTLPTIDNDQRLDVEKYWPLVRQRSPELLELSYLEKAAHYGVFTRSFEFLYPRYTPDVALGFGYPSYIQIGRSQERLVKIRHDETRAQLRLSLEQAINDFNLAIDVYEKSKEGYSNSSAMMKYLSARLASVGFFGDETPHALAGLVRSRVAMLEAQSAAAAAAARIRRLLWRGSPYATISRLIHAKKPDRQIRLWQLFENAKIKRAVRKGKLSLPLTDRGQE